MLLIGRSVSPATCAQGQHPHVFHIIGLGMICPLGQIIVMTLLHKQAGHSSPAPPQPQTSAAALLTTGPSLTNIRQGPLAPGACRHTPQCKHLCAIHSARCGRQPTSLASGASAAAAGSSGPQRVRLGRFLARPSCTEGASLATAVSVAGGSASASSGPHRVLLRLRRSARRRSG